MTAKAFRVYSPERELYVGHPSNHWFLSSDDMLYTKLPNQGSDPLAPRIAKVCQEAFQVELAVEMQCRQRPTDKDTPGKLRWLFANDILVENGPGPNAVYVVVYNNKKSRWQLQTINKGVKRRSLTARFIERKWLVWAGTVHDERYKVMTP